jgi:hypothetical protein
MALFFVVRNNSIALRIFGMKYHLHGANKEKKRNSWGDEG